MAFINIPFPAPVKVEGDLFSNWTNFKAQWEDNEIATGLREKSKNVRVATLRSVMCRDCFRILRNLQITDENCKDQAKCKRHWKIISNQPKMRFTDCIIMFYSCDEGPNENVNQWVNRPRPLSKSCNFEAMADSLLREPVVLGTRDKATRAWTFREKVVNLNEAVEVAA